MKLSNILDKNAILLLEKATDKWDVIHQLLDQLSKTPFVSEFGEELCDTFLAELELRESLGSTGLGEGVAFPHARIEQLGRPLMACAIIRDGVDFGAPDGKPAQLIFLSLLPARRAELGVKINSVCSRFMLQPGIRETLLTASSAAEIVSIIEQNTLEIDAPIIALDLMRAERIRLQPDLSGNQATQLMHRSRTVAAPVVDESGRIIGELNCANLFYRELPDFITKLHSVPPVSDFRPFEKYFSEDAHHTVKDLMTDCDSIIEEKASLLEIIFMITVKKHPVLYVCRDGRLVGVIDPITVLDRVLNL